MDLVSWPAGGRLQIALGNGADDVHPVALGKGGQIGVGIAPRQGSAALVEVPDHRGRRIEVQLAAGTGPTRNPCGTPAGM